MPIMLLIPDLLSSGVKLSADNLMSNFPLIWGCDNDSKARGQRALGPSLLEGLSAPTFEKRLMEQLLQWAITHGKMQLLKISNIFNAVWAFLYFSYFLR